MGRLFVEAAERVADGFEFAGARDAPAVLCADVDGDGVEEVLVVVVFCEAAHGFELDYVFEGCAFEVWVGHAAEV